MQLTKRFFGVAIACVSLSRAALVHAQPEADPAPAAPAEPAPAADKPAEAPAAGAKSGSDLTVRASADVGGYLDSNATSVLTPSVAGTVESPTAGWGVSARYLVDMVSAASPDIVSTASNNFRETRHAGNVGARYKPGNFGVAATGTASYTPDYLSLSGGAQVTQDLDEKNLTLVGSYAYGHDTIGRTGTPFSVFSRDFAYHTISLGASRVVNPGVVVGVYADGVFENGDQSKPYRYIPVFTPAAAAGIEAGASPTTVANARLQGKPLEQLPLSRERFALSGRLSWRATSTTLRLDERLYADTWGLRASTTDARFFVDVSRRWTIWPHARFNVQNSVSFWERAYAARDVRDLPALRTGDRELSSLFTVGAGGGLRVALGGAGRLDDLVLIGTFDGYYTSFADTLYVKTRFSALASTSMEVTF